jgi:hypothetical protein
MRVAILCLSFIFSFSALAEKIQSKIHSIDVSNKRNEPHLILLNNGRVIFLKYHQKELLKSFQESHQNEETIKIDLNDRFEPTGTQTMETDPGVSYENERAEGATNFTYDPTIVNSSDGATAIFKRMRRDYQNNSQCYNRAHIWAWEEFQKTGLKSVKYFLFFTRRYIRNYRYKWWFHVSPSTMVSGLGERILDRRFTSGHRSVNSWTRNFIYSGRTCPVVHKYYDYRNNQESEDCYLIPVSMYFWQPRDIEYRDRTGYEKNQFYKKEINHAYWEAF